MSRPPASLTFAFIREGRSDDGLVPHFRRMLIERGVQEVIGSSREYHGPVASCLESLASEEGSVDLVFIHRDADCRDSALRRRQISDGASDCTIPLVAVVPVQELEAWLLINEEEIRTAVGRPGGRTKLDLPPLSKIEDTASPKEVLREALLTASETTGRRRAKERAKFSLRRSVLLERLDPLGSIRELDSWQAFEADLDQILAELGS